MLFASYSYVAFLALVVVARWASPARAVPFFLLGASYAFYASFGPGHLGVLLFATAFGYALGFAMERMGRRRALLVLGVAAPLSLLGYYKYAGFALEQLGALRSVLGGEARYAHQVLLPVGISFFTFQLVSYVSDVHRGEAAERSPLRFALYLAFFPQLVAGPIVRASELLPQLREPRAADSRMLVDGADVLARGFVKKLVFADNLGRFADALFADPSAFGVAGSWIGVLSYTGQIYCDFSAYTDIARGSAKLLGYELPENFDLPYLSRSITEFWRRWHLTLSRFLRDYLYVPLGGGREGALRQARNLVVTMALGGLWHGAGWTFVLWGLIHGALLFAHKMISLAWARAPSSAQERIRGSSAYALASTISTFLLVAASWVLFRAGSLDDALEVYRGMLGLGAGAPVGSFPEPASKAALLLSALAAAHVLFVFRPRGLTTARLAPALRGCSWACAITVCYLLAGAGEVFIYFRF